MPSTDSSAASLALAEASAASGTTAAKLGYLLTRKALAQSTAATVFPLLALELTSIAESYAAYSAVELAADLAKTQARSTFARGLRYWQPGSV